MNSPPSVLPIVLSAHSELALKATMENLLRYLTNEESIPIHDVAWNLLQKRSVLPVRRSIAGQTATAVCSTLRDEITAIEAKQSMAFTTTAKRTPSILGIFTGQGAQWPAMGRTFVSTIPFARTLVDRLDHSLSTLSPEYRPTWRLTEQLMLEQDASNVHSAKFSQPLCCAVQIILVDLLALAGIKFDVVVGHSSGEIACAYAAGLITASQAIRIAYLRGFVSDLAASPNGAPGSMLAAGCTYEDAEELCNLEMLQGRVCVAASNAPESVTISGDDDAISEVQSILEDEAKFARRLKVDKAYHSFHMQPCAEPYMTAMDCCACGQSTADQKRNSRTRWISSVHQGRHMGVSDVTANYWKDNLLSPVLFSQALEQTFIETTESPFDMIIEVGPHPALQGPTLKTAETHLPGGLPYVGCLRRGANELNTFATALGYLWERFGSASIDVGSVRKHFGPDPAVNFAKSLPPYPWDHSRSYWAESRSTHNYLRGATQSPHALLGRLSSYSTPTTLQWQNTLRPRDLAWMDGHQLHSITVFPGAGFVVMALEAAMHLVGARPVRLLEITKLQSSKAITFENENSLVELNLTLDVVESDAADVDHTTALFRIDCCLSKEKAMSLSTSGEITITYGPGSADALPSAQLEPPHMTNVNLDTFYKELANVGYGYSGAFQGLSSMKRADNKARGTMRVAASEHDQLLLHPATLDVAFQTLFGAVSAPGDGLIRSLLVPTWIGRIAVNPWLCRRLNEQSTNELCYNASGDASHMTTISGDIEVFHPLDRSLLFQIEDISARATGGTTPADDHIMFHKWEWHQLVPDQRLQDPKYAPTDDDREVARVMERMVYFYMKSFLNRMPSPVGSSHGLEPHHLRQIAWFQHMINEAQNEESLFYAESWEHDKQKDIDLLVDTYYSNASLRLIQRVGEGLSQVMYEGRNAFELMDHDGLLSEFYGSVGFGPAYYYLQQALAPIMHRFQNMDILEIGAGTGGATKYILTDDDQPAFNSYTFTDISTSFFETAYENFEQYKERMEFRAFDARRSPESQGYQLHSYDMVIASNVLHATPELETTLSNVRALLKPGGQLFVLELTNRRHSRIGFIFGLFADWWAGVDEGRVLQPFVSIPKWHDLLTRTGFSGVASRFEDEEGEIFPTSVFRSEAIDEKITQLMDPLSAPVEDVYAPLFVIGGTTCQTLLDGIHNLLPHRGIVHVKHLEDILQMTLGLRSSFLVLSELDDEHFLAFNGTKFAALQTLFHHARHVVWLTENAWVKHPEQAALIGLLRSLRLEYTDIHMQVIDVDDVRKLDAGLLCEYFCRLEIGSSWRDDGLLWSTEPELYLSNGRILIPRLKPDSKKNDRLNSRRREIETAADPATLPIVLSQEDGNMYLTRNESHAPQESNDLSTNSAYTLIQTHYSLANAIRVGECGLFYVLLGRTAKDSEIVVALSQTNASLVHVPSHCVVPIANSEVLDEQTGALVLTVAADLLAQTIIAGSARGANIVTFMSSPLHAACLALRAKAQRTPVKFVTTAPLPASTGTSLADEESWIQVHPRETASGIARALRLDNTDWAFYNFSGDKSPLSVSQSLNKLMLARGCRSFTLEQLAQPKASIWAKQAQDVLRGMLQQAVTTASVVLSAFHSTETIATPVQELVTIQRLTDLSTVVDWKAGDLVSARVSAIDSGRLFSWNRTYLLVGLTGDLGRSICRWMVKHGARHVVLSSRNPNIEQRWVEEIKDLGGNVLVLGM